MENSRGEYILPCSHFVFQVTLQSVAQKQPDKSRGKHAVVIPRSTADPPARTATHPQLNRNATAVIAQLNRRKI